MNISSEFRDLGWGTNPLAAERKLPIHHFSNAEHCVRGMQPSVRRGVAERRTPVICHAHRDRIGVPGEGNRTLSRGAPIASSAPVFGLALDREDAVSKRSTPRCANEVRINGLPETLLGSNMDASGTTPDPLAQHHGRDECRRS
jgi:hypothetical protein